MDTYILTVFQSAKWERFTHGEQVSEVVMKISSPN